MNRSEDFLELAGKTVLVFGVANKKSVAFQVARQLEGLGTHVVYSVRSPQRREQLSTILPERDIFVCDVEDPAQIDRLRGEVQSKHPVLHGILHSIAFADYEYGTRPFHQTEKKAFLRAVDISCFSLVALSNAFRDILDEKASVVTISISTTRMASENYGYMAPIKAALDSSLVFLAKSFSQFSQIRFNAVAPALLKTSASAGIPGYVDSYLYAEKVIPRGRAVQSEEAASTAVFLLSPRASGINAQAIVVDAGMSINYFDKGIVGAVVR